MRQRAQERDRNMNNLEKNLHDELDQQLDSGIVEKVLREKFEKCVGDVVEETFRWGNVKRKIEEKIESAMVKYIERNDFSEYVVKLDSVLTEVIKNASVDNKKLLENFEHLMTPPEVETIKASELFEKWCEYVEKNVDTDGLEVNYDDGVSYEPVEVSMEVEFEEGRSWSNFEYAVLRFECEHDERLNFEIRLNRWNQKQVWDINYRKDSNISSLRYLDDFSIYLMRLDQAYVKLELDRDSDGNEVIPEKEPEPTFS